MALTPVLLRYLARTAAWVVPLATILVLVNLGVRPAFGALVGALLVVLDGAGLIYLLGQLLEPTARAMAKVPFMALLLLKLLVSFGVLWALLGVYRIPVLGVAVGLAAGLGATVLGAHRGSSSIAGREAIARDEARIRAEMGDSEAESS